MNLLGRWGKASPKKLEGLKLGDLESPTAFTPDYNEIQFQQACLIFIADELLPGCREHTRMHEIQSTRLCTAYTNRKLTMFSKKYENYSYPVILPPVEAPGRMGLAEPAHIRGELWAIRVPHLVSLDKYKQNGIVFHRERVFLDIPYREKVKEWRDVVVREVDEGPLQLVTNTKDMGREQVEVVGEWKHHKTQSAYMYIGDPEHFFWDGYAEDSFLPMKPKVPADRNLEPFYQYKEDVK